MRYPIPFVCGVLYDVEKTSVCERLYLRTELGLTKAHYFEYSTIHAAVGVHIVYRLEFRDDDGHDDYSEDLTRFVKPFRCVL